MREGGLMKGTSEEGTGRGMDSGREEASRGIERGREGAWEPGREHGSQGGKLQGRYPEEGIGQYPLYSQTIRQRVPCH